MRFLIQTISLIFAMAFSISPVQAKDSITAREIVERIQKNVTCEWAKETVDTFKAGNPDDPVTGIAVTFLATLDVLKKAAESGCNFIITHEPTFYNHTDDVSSLEGDSVLKTKQDYIREHHLIVWRFHDHIHNTNPDGIVKGMVEELGWEKYQKKDDAVVFDIPPVTLKELAADLSQKFPIRTIRIVGNPDLKSGKIGLCVGAYGSDTHIKMLQRDDVEVLLVGESREWETVEYVRDGAAADKRMALILLGHAISEESGMKYCATWLKVFINEVPIKFIPAGEPFWRP